MNFLYRAPESVNRTQLRLLKELDKMINFDKCIVIEQGEGADQYPSSKYVTYDAGIGYNCEYEKIVDLNQLPELDREILELMEVYKSTCLNMTMRNYDLYVGNYYEMEREYLRHLKFWNYVLDKHSIDFMCFSIVPHTLWEYIIYALAKCKKIPTLIFNYSHIPGLVSIGTSIETIGMNTKILYESNAKLRKTDIHEFVKEFVASASKQHSRTPLKEKNVQRINELLKNHYGIYIKRALDDVLCSDNKDKWKYRIHTLKDVCLEQLSVKSVSYYDKMAERELKNEKYVYFALQVTPEMTTLPWAGVFSNQILSIRLLAQSLQPLGIKVYVKEHWFQNYRPKAFYDELRQIPNVICVHSLIDSYKLIQNSVAIASQTGSCITEGIIKGKTILTFVNGYWSGVPSVHLVNCKEDIVNAVNSPISLCKEEIVRYFLSIENTMIRMNLDMKEDKRVETKDTIEDVVDVITKYVNSNFDDNFMYMRVYDNCSHIED